MRVYDDPTEEEPTGRGKLVWVVLAGLLLAGAGAYWVWSNGRVAPAPPAATAPSAPARPSTRKPAATRPEPTAKADAATARRESPAADEPAPAASPAATTGVLRVRSDVPGASVFLDRKFLGTTPLDVDGLAPGSHRLNVSVEGYEGHAQGVDIGDTPAEVDVRFKEVRLNASVPVVHKHGVGSCSGRLVADTAGLRYETSNASDAAVIAFADLETFTVDYLKKNLRVKKRGGKTWNFEDPAGQADPLFVFHRDVDKARAKLAGR
jgi:hypothetical protein